MRVFISGPISNNPDYKKLFNKAEKLLIKQEHSVVNPSFLPEGFSYPAYIRMCIAMLTECDAIALLRGWQNSDGVRAELAEAIRQEKEIILL